MQTLTCSPNRRTRHHQLDRVHFRPAMNMALVRPVARTSLNPGVVVWAHCPFSDCSGEKTRPAVVVGRDGRTISLLPITSSPARLRYPARHFELPDPASVGLDRPCAVKLDVTTIDVIEVIGISGDLDDDAWGVLRECPVTMRLAPANAAR